MAKVVLPFVQQLSMTGYLAVAKIEMIKYLTPICIILVGALSLAAIIIIAELSFKNEENFEETKWIKDFKN